MKLGSRSAFWWRLVAVVGLFVLSTTDTTAQNITELEQRVEILEVEMENVESTIDSIVIDVDHQDSRITVVEVTSIQHTNDIADLTVSIDDTEDSMALLLERVAVLEATNNLLQERMGVLENTVEEQAQTIEEQAQTIADLEGADNSTNHRLQEIEGDVQDTTLRLTSVEEEVSAHDSELSSLTENMAVLEDTVDDVEDGMTLIEAQNADIQERLTVLEEAVIIPWVACASSPCDNGATCIDVNIDTFICMCRDGYYGNTCQYTPTEACGSSPCTNGGTCLDVNVETFTCSCRDGFFGTTCEQSYSGMSFLATFYDNVLTPTDPIVFGLPILNPGRHYDATTGIYTVPLDGIYEFVVKIQSYLDYSIEAYLVVDGEQATYTWSYGDSGYAYLLLESVVVLSLTAGQQVWVQPSGISNMYGAYNHGMYSWFSGHLVHAI